MFDKHKAKATPQVELKQIDIQETHKQHNCGNKTGEIQQKPKYSSQQPQRNAFLNGL